VYKVQGSNMEVMHILSTVLYAHMQCIYLACTWHIPSIFYMPGIYHKANLKGSICIVALPAPRPGKAVRLEAAVAQHRDRYVPILGRRPIREERRSD
jgi:hypothetical protein